MTKASEIENGLATAPLTVRQIFEGNRQRPWVFLRPLGNWGDHLIFAGAERMANALGLKWSSCETPEFRTLTTTPEHCIYLQGGGGYNPWCSGRAFENLELALARSVHQVVQGPVSVDGNLKWLAARMRSSIDKVNCDSWVFFAREKHTFGLLCKLGLSEYGASVHIDDDTALTLAANDLLEIAGLKTMPDGSYDLVVLREDYEAPVAKPTTTVAARTVPSAGISFDPAYVAKSFAHWVSIHLHARRITTNRLHSAIIGAIAGKPVSIGPGSYHKNESVWKHSLASRGVAWVHTIEPPPTPLWRLLPERIKCSYKVRQLRLALQGVPLR